MTPPRTFAELNAGIDALATRWQGERADRQARRHLERADFDALADVGFLLAAVPVEQGGLWESVAASTRPMCAALRRLAAADASVALVLAMHPAVLSYWLASDGEEDGAWQEQRRARALASAADGRQWGTITSEPGSGGDIMRTKTRAEPGAGAGAAIPGQGYVLTGDKHFGSGFGISDYMFTTALPDGEEIPAAFFMDMRATRRRTETTPSRSRPSGTAPG